MRDFIFSFFSSAEEDVLFVLCRTKSLVCFIFIFLFTLHWKITKIKIIDYGSGGRIGCRGQRENNWDNCNSINNKRIKIKLNLKNTIMY